MEWEEKKEDEVIEFSHVWVDFDFVKTMGMELAAGRDFSKDMGNDSTGVILNEAAIKAMGMEDPIGKRFNAFGRGDGQIVGVIKDFHSNDMFSTIHPLLVVLDYEHYSMYVRTAPGVAQPATSSCFKTKPVVPTCSR
jgi:hypothetical protein